MIHNEILFCCFKEYLQVKPTSLPHFFYDILKYICSLIIVNKDEKGY